MRLAAQTMTDEEIDALWVEWREATYDPDDPYHGDTLAEQTEVDR